MEVIHAICLRGVLEHSIWFYVVHMHFTWMECVSTCVTCGSLEANCFFSQVHPSVPGFFSGPEIFERENAFSFDVLVTGIGGTGSV